MAGVFAAACAAERTSYLRGWDSTWLQRNHECDHAVEPLALDAEAERLVGLQADEVFARGSRVLQVSWQGSIPPEEAPWQLSVDGSWDEVRAVRSLRPTDCPSGLVLEANDQARLEFPGGGGDGDWWITASEVAPTRPFWSWRATVPAEAAPASLRRAIDAARTPETKAARVAFFISHYPDQRYIIVDLELEDEWGLGSGWASQPLASGTFEVVADP